MVSPLSLSPMAEVIEVSGVGNTVRNVLGNTVWIELDTPLTIPLKKAGLLMQHLRRYRPIPVSLVVPVIVLLKLLRSLISLPVPVLRLA